MKTMKKMGKKQWRITIPNLTAPILGKISPTPSQKATKRSSSGFYDFTEAQMDFDKGRSLPSSIYVNSTSSSTTSSADEEATTYEDIKTVRNIDKNNGKFEYDVPRISFKFFERKAKIEEAVYANGEPVLSTTMRSEVKIILQSPDEEIVPKLIEESKISDKDIEEALKELDDIGCTLPMKRSDSDPQLNLRTQCEELYKVPRNLKAQHRLSRSLSDIINCDDIQLSLDHVSCSQNNLAQFHQSTPVDSFEESKLDYCEERSKLPHCQRRVTLLRKPHKTKDRWANFKMRFNQKVTEQASQQRVGAFSDKGKNLEEMLKSSKEKCRKFVQNSSKVIVEKMSRQRRRSEDSNSSNVSDRPKLTASDIEYRLNISEGCEGESPKSNLNDNNVGGEDQAKEEYDFSTIKSTFKKKLTFTPVHEGQNGFEDLRRYVKQGGDFCKELATILQERAEAESQYAKSLSKLSGKLSRACREGVGGLNEAWKAVAIELEAKAEAHRITGQNLLEDTAKPLRNLTEGQHRFVSFQTFAEFSDNSVRTRKQCETAVDKAAKLLGDWRAAEAKGKKHSHGCARDNEKLQDAALIDTTKFGKQTLSKSASLIQLAQRQNSADKENAKLEGKKKKAEDAVKKADIDYYTLCVKAERSRLEWESAVLRGVNTFQTLEEERLQNLKLVLVSYIRHSTAIQPRLIDATEHLKAPIEMSDPSKDLVPFQNLRQTSQQVSEQLLPDFYCEHITLAMNRDRRKQALVKLLHLIRQDIERERKSKNGLENLSNAIKQTPNFGNEDSQQSVVEKLYHMKSMLTYLEGARYKVQSALAELDSHPRSSHPLAPHITITRDKSGLQQSVLKVPQWLREEFFETDRSPMSEKSLKSDISDPHSINDVEGQMLNDWPNRTAGDGNSNQPDSDFDDFSSQCSSTEHNLDSDNVQPIAKCKAIYAYTPNLSDELSLNIGDILKVYRQQDDGWWLGECNGNVGIFPATYVEILPA